MHIKCQLYSLTFGCFRNCYSVISFYCDVAAKFFGKCFKYIQSNQIFSFKLTEINQQEIKVINICYKMFSFRLNEAVNYHKKY